jgi:hypothetical protein
VERGELGQGLRTVLRCQSRNAHHLAKGVLEQQDASEMENEFDACVR